MRNNLVYNNDNNDINNNVMDNITFIFNERIQFVQFFFVRS